jgi:vanillate O-demethylase ferredoxin subunit
MLLRVHAVATAAEDIRIYDLVDAEGRDLPPFSAGAHVDVHLSKSLVRQYSLCNAPAERNRYRIAVLREKAGRGGSQFLHDNIKKNDLVRVEGPRNNFPLAEGARRHVLIAGGIGVTPMIAMIADLMARGEDFHLHYCTRTIDKTAFHAELGALAAAGKVSHHFDNGDPANGLDFVSLLRNVEIGTHLYYCGPPGFMQAVRSASAHWPSNAVHLEHFTAPVDRPAPSSAQDRAFRVKLKSTGAEYEIPVGRTIIDVLREHGVDVQTSCEEGYCGTCMTPFLEGVPDHRSDLLDDEAREQYVLICCARARSDVLVLDL